MVIFEEWRLMFLTIKKTDPRVLKTRNNLRRALVFLIQQEPLESISVQKITQTAHITRGTFYLHYKDKQDFIEATLQDFIDEFFGSVMYIPENAIKPVKVFSLKCAFAYIEQNADIFAVLLGESFGNRFYQAMYERLRKEMFHYAKVVAISGKQVEVPIEMQIDFVASAVLGLISRWLEGGLVYTSRYMTINVSKMLARNMEVDDLVANFFSDQLQIELGVQPA